MELYERIFWMLVGGVGGYIVALLRQIKEDLESVDECVKHCQLDHVHMVRPSGRRRRVKDEGGFMRRPLIADLAYLFALGLILFGLWQQGNITRDIQAKAHADLVARCQAGTETRTVQRQTVEAIYNLAIGSVKRDANAPPLTKQELGQYNAYIARVNQFREDLYMKIVPSDQCKPYVEDDLVVPPTPPTPPIVQDEGKKT